MTLLLLLTMKQSRVWENDNKVIHSKMRYRLWAG
jgi:hypothetical protein